MAQSRRTTLRDWICCCFSLAAAERTTIGPLLTDSDVFYKPRRLDVDDEPRRVGSEVGLVDEPGTGRRPEQRDQIDPLAEIALEERHDVPQDGGRCASAWVSVVGGLQSGDGKQPFEKA